jgi:hypothetical protein
MRKIGFLLGLLIFLAIGVFADTSISLSIGGEGDQYSIGGFGGGFAGNIDYRFNELFSLGEFSVYSFDFGSSGAATLELGATVRYYFLRTKKLLDYYYLWQNKFHLFLQLDVGGAWAYLGDNDHLSWSDCMIGGVFGLRRFFGENDMFYFEPYLRYSTTSYLGAGILLGMSFYANPR